MSKIKNSFYTGILSLVVLAVFIQFACLYLDAKEYISRFFWEIQLFVGLVSILAHLVTSKGLKNKADFHIYYMGSMTIRMFAAMGFLLAFVLYMTDNQEVFIINFLITYFAYTGFEIYYLLTNLRPDSEKNEKKDS
jgi:hypothetical protein